MKTLSLVIKGQTYSKSNSRIFAYNNGTPRMFKNPTVAKYVEDARLQIKTQLKEHHAFTGPIKIESTIYYQSRRSDLDISLVQDILEQKIDKKYKVVIFEGVYKNDRQVEEIHLIRKIDKENPRVEVIITELSE